MKENPMSDWQQIKDMQRGADMITDSARADGLPAPQQVHCNSWKVEVQLADRVEVEAWARWRGTIVTETPTIDRTGRILRAKGEMYELPLEVYTVVPLLCACGHAAAEHITPLGCKDGYGTEHTCPCAKSRVAVIGDDAIARSQESHAQAMAIAR